MVLYLMNINNSNGFYDLIKVVLFSVLIVLAFSVQTVWSRVFEPIGKFSKQFSVAVYVVHGSLLSLPMDKLQLPWKYECFLWIIIAVVVSVCAAGFTSCLVKLLHRIFYVRRSLSQKP